MRNKSDLVEVSCNIHARTDKAILVSDDGDPSNGVWLPKSQIEFVELGQSIVEVTMPEWLALDKGLI